MTCATLGRAVRPRVTVRRVVLAVFVIALVVEIRFAAPYVSGAFDRLGDVGAGWVVAAVVAELASMSAFARLQRRMLASGGTRVSLPRMIALTYAANSISATLPGGSVVSTVFAVRRMRRWGASVTAAGFTVVSSGLLSTIAFAALALVAALFADTAGWSSTLVLVVAALAVLWVGHRRRHGGLLDPVRRVAVGGLHVVNRIRHRASASGVDALETFLAQLGAVHPRRRDWLLGGGSAAVNWVADVACLIAAAHAVGAGDADLSLLLLAWVAGLSSANLTLLPGGLGVMDAAMVLTLTGGGVSVQLATAAVVLYRLVSFGLVVVLGWVTWTAGAVRDRRDPACVAQRAQVAGRGNDGSARRADAA